MNVIVFRYGYGKGRGEGREKMYAISRTGLDSDCECVAKHVCACLLACLPVCALVKVTAQAAIEASVC